MTTKESTTESAAGEGPPPTLTPAFSALFEQHFDYVCRSLQRLGVREADAEDVAQELFLAVHRALPESDASRPMKPWLFAFAMRYASNYRRLSWHRGRELDDTPVSPTILDKLAAKRLVMGLGRRQVDGELHRWTPPRGDPRSSPGSASGRRR